jgi:outer membrane immunogenic protein
MILQWGVEMGASPIFRHLVELLASVILIAGICIIAAPPSLAKGSPSNEQMWDAITALQARVATLEEELRKSKNIQNEERVAPPMLLSSLPAAANPLTIGTPARGIQEPPLYANWSGFYWGTAFGVGSASSHSRYRTFRQFNSQNSEVSTVLESDGTTTLQTFTDFSESSDALSGITGTDQHQGALGDLYLGVNGHLTPRILLGAQVEGSLVEMSFDSKLKNETGTFTQSFRNTQTEVSSDGSTSQSSNSASSAGTQTNRYPGSNQLQLDWMVSIIGRAGWLATPSTYLYGLAGWSYGHFEVDELQFGFGLFDEFGAHGPTVGGGIEQKLSPKWSLRAEYRYTDFGEQTVSASGSSRFAQSGSGIQQNSSSCCGSSLSNSTEQDVNGGTDNSSGVFDNSMHVGRIGVTRYFTAGD